MTSNDDEGTLAELRRCVVADGSRRNRARAAAEIIRRAGNYRWVGLYDVTAAEIAAIGWSGESAPSFPRFPVTQGLNGAAVAERAPVVANDVAHDPRYLTTFGTTRAETIVPFVSAAGAVLGTMDVESERVNAFGERDVAFLSRCALALAPLWEEGSAAGDGRLPPRTAR